MNDDAVSRLLDSMDRDVASLQESQKRSRQMHIEMAGTELDWAILFLEKLERDNESDFGDYLNTVHHIVLPKLRSARKMLPMPETKRS